MVTTMSYQVRLNSAKFLLVAIVFAATALAWSYFLALRPAIIYSNPQSQPVHVCSGSVMQLTRTLEFTRPLELTISRALTRENLFGEVETIGLSSITVSRDKQIIHQSRSIYIPKGTPFGEWTLKTYITSSELPFWHITHEAPDIKVVVDGRCE